MNAGSVIHKLPTSFISGLQYLPAYFIHLGQGGIDGIEAFPPAARAWFNAFEQLLQWRKG